MGSAKHPAKDRAKRKNVCKECHLKAICFWVIGHILDTTYLLLKLLRFLGFVIGWLNEADLSVFFQKQIVFQTFIPCICGYFFVSGLMVLLQLLQEWNKRAEVCSVRNTSTPVMYSLFTAIWTLYAGFSCPFRMWSSFILMKVASGSVLE